MNVPPIDGSSRSVFSQNRFDKTEQDEKRNETKVDTPSRHSEMGMGGGKRAEEQKQQVLTRFFGQRKLTAENRHTELD